MTKPSPSEMPRGFSTSAWQALERAAVTRRSAATVLRLLAKLAQPIIPASPRLPSTAPQAPAQPHAVGVPFEQWAALTDAYAEQFLRMQRGDASARGEAMRLSKEMLRMNEAMKCTA